MHYLSAPFTHNVILFYLLLRRLNYDAATNTYTPNAGVSVRVAGANGSDVTKAEYLDNFELVSYFHEMVEYFVDRGYVRDVSIRAAPYDWRFAAGNQARTCTDNGSN